MNPYVYYIGTTVLLALIIIGAITIKDPSLVFDGMSGLFLTSLLYIIPSLMFLQAHN